MEINLGIFFQLKWKQSFACESRVNNKKDVEHELQNVNLTIVRAVLPTGNYCVCLFYSSSTRPPNWWWNTHASMYATYALVVTMQDLVYVFTLHVIVLAGAETKEMRKKIREWSSISTVHDLLLRECLSLFASFIPDGVECILKNKWRTIGTVRNLAKRMCYCRADTILNSSAQELLLFHCFATYAFSITRKQSTISWECSMFKYLNFGICILDASANFVLTILSTSSPSLSLS